MTAINKKIELLNEQHEVFENRIEMLEDTVQKLIEENKLLKEMILLQNEVLRRCMKPEFDENKIDPKPLANFLENQGSTLAEAEGITKRPKTNSSFAKFARRLT